MLSVLQLLSYPRSLLATFLCYIWTFFWSLLCLFGGQVFKATWWGDFVMSTWSMGALKLFNVRIELFGSENFSDNSGIFVFNHSSHFDILILMQALKSKSIRFGAKAELFKIPVFGSAMKNIKILTIHRSQRDKVLELYKKSLINLNFGINYVLAPEGTRQDNEQMGQFKSGPFIMAIAGQCEVLPVIIKGAHNVLPKGKWLPAWGAWSSHVEVHILPPISTAGMCADNKADLVVRVQQEMEEKLKILPHKNDFNKQNNFLKSLKQPLES